MTAFRNQQPCLFVIGFGINRQVCSLKISTRARLLASKLRVFPHVCGNNFRPDNSPFDLKSGTSRERSDAPWATD
jgi:hypothetical protein